MKYSVDLSESEEGDFIAACPAMGLTSRGLSQANALDQMRASIRYNIEWCPCSTVDEDYIELDVTMT